MNYFLDHFMLFEKKIWTKKFRQSSSLFLKQVGIAHIVFCFRGGRLLFNIILLGAGTAKLHPTVSKLRELFFARVAVLVNSPK